MKNSVSKTIGGAVKIGVLDIQGSVEEHFAALSRISGVEVVLVKKARDLDGLTGLVIPGGESTTLSKLIDIFGLREPILKFVRGGGRVYGTCAGAILLAKKVYSVVDGETVIDQKVKPLGLIDIDVVRNAYGRQLHSFETEIEVDFCSCKKDGRGNEGDDGRENCTKIPAVFIRAPKISRVGRGVDILASYKGEPILVKSGNVLAGAFHPEMTECLEVYKKFFLG